MTDMLRMDYINSIPQPLWVELYSLSGWWWLLEDICVVTGLLRIDVCGLLQIKDIGDVAVFRDAAGNEHHPDTFYSDWEGVE